jgi:transposase
MEGASMSDHFKRSDHHQQPYLLPPSLQDWLPQDHVAFFLRDVLDQLDLSDIRRAYSGGPKGQPPYDPQMMLAVLIYAYCMGIHSSRKIEKETYEDVAVRILASNEHPHYTTIAAFRRTHLKRFKELFKQVLILCEQAGLVKLGHVSLDGSKIKANASKHKAMSYDRMQKREKEIQEQIEKLTEQAEKADSEEDERYGKDKRGDELPEELRIKKARLEKIRQAKQALEETARQAAQEKQDQRAELERQAHEEGRQLGGHPPKIDPTPDPKAQRNFTDPESRIMKGPDGFVQAYNAQAVVDEKAQIVVACDVTNCPVDTQQVEPMMQQLRENLGRNPEKASLDAGYYSEANEENLLRRGIDPYIATGRQKHDEKVEGSPRGRIPKNASAKERMKRKLMTRRGKKIYSRRKVIIEPVFGQIKTRGFRKFSHRGQEKARGEWAFVCTIHNLLKLFRAGNRTTFN